MATRYKYISDDMYKQYAQNFNIEEQRLKAYQSYLNSQPQSEYDDGSLWSLPSNYGEPFLFEQKPTMSNNDIYGLNDLYKKYYVKPAFANKKELEFDEFDPLQGERSQVDYYTNKLKELGINPESPDEIKDTSNMNAFDKTLDFVFNSTPFKAFDWATKGLQAGGNVFWGLINSNLETLDEDLKRFEDNNGFGDNIKDIGKLLFDFSINPEKWIKNIGAGLESGGATLAGYASPFLDEKTNKELQDKQIGAYEVLDKIDKGESKALQTTGDVIDAVNPFRWIAEKGFGVDEEKAKEYGKLGLSLVGEVALAPDISDAAKANKFVKNFDKVKDAEKALTDLDKLDEARAIANKQVPYGSFEQQYRDFKPDASKEEILLAHSNEVNQLANTAIRKGVEYSGGMPDFEGVKLDGIFGKVFGGKVIDEATGAKDPSHVIINRETLENIAKSPVKKLLFETGSAVLSPINAIGSSKVLGNWKDKFFETGAGKEIRKAFSGGELAQAKQNIKENPEKATEYVAQALGMKYAGNDFRANVQLIAKKVSKLSKDKDLDLEAIRRGIEEGGGKFVKKNVIEEVLTPEYMDEIKDKTLDELSTLRETRKNDILTLGEEIKNAPNEVIKNKKIEEFQRLSEDYKILTTVETMKSLDVKQNLKGKIPDTDLEVLPDNIIFHGANKNLNDLTELMKQYKVSNPRKVAEHIMRVSNNVLDGIRDRLGDDIAQGFRGVSKFNAQTLVTGESNKLISPNNFDNLNTLSKRHLGKELNMDEISKYTPEQEKALVDEIMSAKEKGEILDDLKNPELDEKRMIGKTEAEDLKIKLKESNYLEKKLKLNEKEVEEVYKAIDKNIENGVESSKDMDLPSFLNDKKYGMKDIRSEFYSKAHNYYYEERAKLKSSYDKNPKPKVPENYQKVNDEVVEKFKYATPEKEELNKAKVKNRSGSLEDDKHKLNKDDEDFKIKLNDDTYKVKEKIEHTFITEEIKTKQDYIEEYSGTVEENISKLQKNLKKVYDFIDDLEKRKIPFSDENKRKYGRLLKSAIVNQLYAQGVKNKAVLDILDDIEIFPRMALDKYGNVVDATNGMNLESIFQMNNAKAKYKMISIRKSLELFGSDKLNVGENIINLSRKRRLGKQTSAVYYNSPSDKVYDWGKNYNGPVEERKIPLKSKKLKDAIASDYNERDVWFKNLISDDSPADTVFFIKKYLGRDITVDEFNGLSESKRIPLLDELQEKMRIDISNNLGSYMFTISGDRDKFHLVNKNIQTMANDSGVTRAMKEIKEASLKSKDAPKFAMSMFKKYFKEDKDGFANFYLPDDEKITAGAFVTHMRNKYGKEFTVNDVSLEITSFLNRSDDNYKLRPKMQDVYNSTKYDFEVMIEKGINDAQEMSLKYLADGLSAEKYANDLWNKYFVKETSGDIKLEPPMTKEEFFKKIKRKGKYVSVESAFNIFKKELFNQTTKDADNFASRYINAIDESMAKAILKEVKSSGITIYDEKAFLKAMQGNFIEEIGNAKNGALRMFLMQQHNDLAQNLTKAEADLILEHHANLNQKDVSAQKVIQDVARENNIKLPNQGYKIAEHRRQDWNNDFAVDRIEAEARRQQRIDKDFENQYQDTIEEQGRGFANSDYYEEGMLAEERAGSVYLKLKEENEMLKIAKTTKKDLQDKLKKAENPKQIDIINNQIKEVSEEITETEANIAYLGGVLGEKDNRVARFGDTSFYNYDNFKKEIKNKAQEKTGKTKDGKEFFYKNSSYSFTFEKQDVEMLRQYLYDIKTKHYMARRTDVDGKTRAEGIKNIENKIRLMSRSEVELSIYKTLVEAREYIKTEKLPDDKATSMVRQLNVPHIKQYLEKVPDVVQNLGLNKAKSEFTNVDRKTLQDLVNLKKNITIISMTNPEKYREIIKATNGLDARYISHSGLAYISDYAFMYSKRNPAKFEDIPQTPLTALLNKESLPTINEIEDMNLKSDMFKDATKRVEDELKGNPLIAYGINGATPKAENYLMFETPGGGMLNINANLAEAPQLSVTSLSDSRAYITADLGDYYGVQKGNKLAVSVNADDVQSVLDHEITHYLMEKLNIAKKEARSFGKLVSARLMELDGEQRNALVDLIESVGIDKTDIELIANGLLTKNIAHYKKVQYKFGNETIATLGSYLTHTSADVRLKFRELIGDDVTNKFFETLKGASNEELKEVRKFARNNIGVEAERKIDRMSAILNTVFKNDERVKDIYDMTNRINGLETLLNNVDDANKEISDIAKKNLIEYHEKNNPEFMNELNRQVEMYKKVQKEVDEFEATINKNGLKPSEVEVMDFIVNKFAEIAVNEGYASSFEDAKKYMNYVPHQYSPEWRNSPQQAKWVMNNEAIFNSPVNHFMKSRKISGTVTSINESTMNKFGVKMLEDNILRMVLNRTVKSETIMYKQRALDAMLEVTDEKGNVLAKGLGRKVLVMAEVKELQQIKNGTMTVQQYFKEYCTQRGIEPIINERGYEDYVGGYYETLTPEYLNENGLMYLRELPKLGKKSYVNTLPSDVERISDVNKRAITDELDKVASFDKGQIMSVKSPLDDYSVISPSDFVQKEVLEGTQGTLYIVDKRAYDTFKVGMDKNFKKDRSGFLKLYDKINGVFKMMAVLTGRFHFNNSVGNIFNSFIGAGVNMLNPVTSYETVQVMMGKPINIAGKSGAEIMFDLKRSGLITNTQLDQEFTQGSVNEFVDGVSKTLDKPTSLTRRVLDPTSNEWIPAEVNKKIGDTIENYAKVMNYITHLKRGLPEQKALELVKRALFDYSDLTDFEANVMRRIIPFYTYLKKNTALQIDAFVNNPYKYYMITRTINEINNANETEQERMLRPDYMKNDIALGGGKYLNLNLPLYDMTKAFNPKELISGLNPMIKTPLEITTNKNFFTGSEISKNNKAKDYAEHALNNFLPAVKNAGTARDAMLGDNSAMTKLKALAGNPVRGYDKKLSEKMSMRSYADKLKAQYYGTLEENPELQAYLKVLEEKKKREQAIKKIKKYYN
ncbi:MAG: hypothetical protein ACRC2K_13280 [Clostridium sp.]